MVGDLKIEGRFAYQYSTKMPPKKHVINANGDEDPKNVPEVVKKPSAKKKAVEKAEKHVSTVDTKPNSKTKSPKNTNKLEVVKKPSAKKKAVEKAETQVSTVDTKPKSKTKPTKKTENTNEPDIVKVVVLEPTKLKKKYIPKNVKDLTWNKWIGDDIAKHVCLCCETIEIKMNSFHCGHIIAESKGGITSVENLKPICATCNLSMGTNNFDDFKKRCGFMGGAKKAKPIVRKAKEPSIEKIRKEKLTQLLISGDLSLCPGKEEKYDSIGSLFKRSACSNSFPFTKHCDRCNNHYHSVLGTKMCPCFSIW
jgi:hypothetical protein